MTTPNARDLPRIRIQSQWLFDWMKVFTGIAIIGGFTFAGFAFPSEASGLPETTGFSWVAALWGAGIGAFFTFPLLVTCGLLRNLAAALDEAPSHGSS